MQEFSAANTTRGDEIRSLMVERTGNFLQRMQLGEPERAVTMTDASLIGWGAHTEGKMAQSLWTEEQMLSIYLLELRAIHLGLLHCQHRLEKQHVPVRTNNTTAKVHVNRQGGTRVRSLHLEAVQTMTWAEAHLNLLKVVHAPGLDNVLADSLSREVLNDDEWMLYKEVLARICKRFGTPEIDLFTSEINHQVPSFVPRGRNPKAIGVDALICSWPQCLLYAFPPIQLVASVVQRVLQQRVTMVPRLNEAIDTGIMAAAGKDRSTEPEESLPSIPRVVKSHSMEVGHKIIYNPCALYDLCVMVLG